MCHPVIRNSFEPDYIVSMVRKVFDGRVTFHDGVGYRLGSSVCALTEAGPNVITLLKDRRG
jgi:hypothetical protein